MQLTSFHYVKLLRTFPRTFSRISRARLHNGSASLYFPLFPYKTAKLFKVAATYKQKEHVTLEW